MIAMHYLKDAARKSTKSIET